MPDVYQSGITAGYNQQWSHAFIYNSWGYWCWGDADDDFHDNINGETSEFESPEGYNSKSASYYYTNGNRDLGDWYLGYACHYIADVNFTLHTTFPDANMALHHFDYEAWIANNWTTGWNFKQYVDAVPASSFYNVTDLKGAINSAAYYCNTNFSSSAYNAWYWYKAAGYPTGSGTGTWNAAYYTKSFVENATKWTGGTIRYTLNKYNKW
jgi:hypothetical protein